MKTIRLMRIVFTLLLMLSSSTRTEAQEPPGEWVSGIACQNPDEDNDVFITIAFFEEQQEDPNPALTFDDTIQAGHTRTYYLPNIGGLPFFTGAAKIYPSGPVNCTVNTQTTGTGTEDEPYRIGTSSVLSSFEAGKVVYAPQVMKEFGGWNSYIAVQNDSADDVIVIVTYLAPGGDEITPEIGTIPAYTNQIFYQAGNEALPGGFIGAARISAYDPPATKLAVIVNYYNSGSGIGSENSQMHSYNGFSRGSRMLYVPRFVRRFYGYNSGLSIQNVGDIATTLTVDFTFPPGTKGREYGELSITYSPGITLEPGASLALYATNPDIVGLDQVDSRAMWDRFGSAIITANEPGAMIVAIVNEDNRGDPADNDWNPVPVERIGQGATYNAFLSGSWSKEITFPQIVNNAGDVFSGGFQIANVAGAPGSCTAAFGASGVNYPIQLGDYGSASVYAPDVPGLPDGYNASATVSCDVDIIGISNLAAKPGSGKLGDSFTTDNGR